MNYNNIMLINQDMKPEGFQDNGRYVSGGKDGKMTETVTSDLDSDSLPHPMSLTHRFESAPTMTKRDFKQRQHKLSLQLSPNSFNNSVSSLRPFMQFRMSNSAMNLSNMMSKPQWRMEEDVSEGSINDKIQEESPTRSIQSTMTAPDIYAVIPCLRSDDVEVQFNAAAFLQHVTFKNEESKEIVRRMDGIPPLISMMSSHSSTCQINAASVLRNLSHGPNVQIKIQIQQCGGLEILESMLDHCHQLERRLTEAVVAILCNLSCHVSFQVPLVNSCLEKVVLCALLPLLGIKINPKSGRILDFRSSDLSFPYGALLGHITAFLKNLSSGRQYIRQQLRHCEGLIDSVIAIIQHSSETGCLDSTIVENCVCIVRNLCYALQEVVDPDYLSKKSLVDNESSEKRAGGSETPRSFGSRSSKDLLLTPRSTRLNSTNSRPSLSGGVVRLWDEDIIDLLLVVINDSNNHSSVEAAIGAVQNMAACDWHLAEEFRFNFRKKKGLPALVIQLNNGPDRVIKVTLAAFRNLGQDDRNLDLIGKHCLYHLIRLLPSPTNPVIKRIVVGGSENEEAELPEEYVGLDTIYGVLSLIYFIIKSATIFCREFVEMNGVKGCMFLLKSDTFYKEHLHNSSPKQSENADKIPVLCASILQMIWSVAELGPYFKKEKLGCEDFCVQTRASELKSNLSCSQKDAPKASGTYFGKPYVKARNNALLPWTLMLNQRHQNPSNEYDHKYSATSTPRTRTEPDLFNEGGDGRPSPWGPQPPLRGKDKPRMDSESDVQRRQRVIQKY